MFTVNTAALVWGTLNQVHKGYEVFKLLSHKLLENVLITVYYVKTQNHDCSMDLVPDQISKYLSPPWDFQKLRKVP